MPDMNPDLQSLNYNIRDRAWRKHLMRKILIDNHEPISEDLRDTHVSFYGMADEHFSQVVGIDDHSHMTDGYVGERLVVFVDAEGVVRRTGWF